MLSKILRFFKKEDTPPLVSNIDKAIRADEALVCYTDIVVTEHIHANIFCGGKLTVGPGAMLKGNITANACYIEGAVDGNIAVISTVEIKAAAAINGNIHAPVVNIQEGAQINGRVNVNNETTPTQVDLLNILKRYSAEAFKAVNTKPKYDERTSAPVENKTEGKTLNTPLKAANQQEVPEKERSSVVVQKELSAAAPQPHVAGNNSEINNRWW